MSDFKLGWRRPRVRWKPAGRRIDWQTPVILGLVSFAVVMAVMTAMDRYPSLLSSIGSRSFVELRSPAAATQPYGASIDIARIIDGDTVVATGGEHYRLVGFDTPEKGDLAHCDFERQLATRATARLSELIARGHAKLNRIACACRPGTEGTRRCNFGRLCGMLTVDGQDVGDVLIEEGLAHRYVCSGTRCPRRPSWC